MADPLEIILLAKDGTKEAFGSVREGLGKIGESSKGTGELLKGLGVAAVGASVAIGAALVGAASKGLSTMMEWNEGIDSLIDRFGVSGSQASGMAVAFEHVGLSVEGASTGLNLMTRQLTDAADKMAAGDTKGNKLTEGLARMGLSLKDLTGRDGKLKNMSDILPTLADGFAKLPPGIERTTIAMELFGPRAGTKFIDLLAQGGDALKGFEKSAKDMGLSIDTETSAKIEELGFTFNDLGLQMKGAWNIIGVSLLPVFKDLSTFLATEVLPRFTAFARDVMPKVLTAIKDIDTWIRVNLLPAFNAIVAAIQTGDLSKIGETIAGILKGAWAKIEPELAKWGLQFWDWLVKPGGAIDVAGNQLALLLVAINVWAKSAETKKQLSGAGETIGTALVDAVSAVFDAKETKKSLGNTLANLLKGVLYSIPGLILDAITGMVTGIASRIAEKITGGTVKEEFKEAFKTVLRAALGDLAELAITIAAPQLQIFKQLGFNVMPNFQTDEGEFKTVPGGRNQGMLAMVHGGETIGRGGGGNGMTVVFNYAPAVSLATRQEAQDILQPFIERGIVRARTRQIGATA